MFYYLDGTVAHIEAHLAVIDCGGVGYACRTTGTTTSQLRTGERVKLFTYLHVAEGIFDLYGFLTEEERDTYLLLLAVSGVGPKAALAILSALTPQKLTAAVVSSDEGAFTTVSGIGKKTAQRIILELKDKLTGSSIDLPGTAVPAGTSEGSGHAVSEAISALAVLGYQQQVISAAMKGLPVETMTTEEIVRQCLKRM